MPLVSVVMPVYNSERYLAEAIESILAQTFTDFELIIVDDASEDRSADIIRGYQKQDARIQFVQLQQNEGPGSARNRGIRAAGGQYIAAMDSDDISLPERLRLQVEYLGSNPEVGAVGVGTQKVNADLSPRSAFRLPGSHALIALEMIAGGMAIVRASMMMRRRFLLSSGGYDMHPEFKISTDSELTLRLLWETGIRYGNILETQYLYRQHETNISLENDPRDSCWLRRRALERLWGEAPHDAVERLRKSNLGIKLSWRDRRLARQDYRRLIGAMVDARWIELDEIAALHAEINRRLETTTPRLWQKFCHWRRHHFGGDD